MKRWLTLLLGTPLSITLVANYNGYCLSNKKFFSDEEKKIIVMKEIYSSLNVKYLDNDYYIKRERGSKYIPYKNFEEFIEINKQCCAVSFHQRNSDFIGPGFKERLTGEFSSYVNVEYKARYLVNGNIVSHTVIDDRAISNCGYVYNSN